LRIQDLKVVVVAAAVVVVAVVVVVVAVAVSKWTVLCQIQSYWMKNRS
jgi:hypothetical protein